MMRRREFAAFLAGAAASLPLAVRAQQPAIPVVGFLSPAEPAGYASQVVAFRQGLNEGGFSEGRNIAIEFCWAQGQFDRLPALAADLVRRQVAVIMAFAPAAARAAHAATKTIPVVFVVGNDPVRMGIVASLNRPGGNITGVAFFANTLGAKRIGLLRELIPKLTAITMIVNPSNPASEAEANDAQTAARTLGQTMHVLKASSEGEIDSAFATHVGMGSGAVIIGADAFFNSRREQFVALSKRHAVPLMSQWREFPAAGSLISYGASVTDAARQGGVYVSRILKGERPADLPVLQSTKFELVVNLTTAKALGLTVAPMLLALADEVIE